MRTNYPCVWRDIITCLDTHFDYEHDIIFAAIFDHEIGISSILDVRVEVQVFVCID